jgi:hypothetical protein
MMKGREREVTKRKEKRLKDGKKEARMGKLSLKVIKISTKSRTAWIFDKYKKYIDTPAS